MAKAIISYVLLTKLLWIYHEINKLQDLTFPEKVFKPVEDQSPERYWSNQMGTIGVN